MSALGADLDQMERENAQPLAGNGAQIDQQGSSCAGENISSIQAPQAAFIQENLRLVATVSSKQLRQQLPANDSNSAVLTVLGGKASCRRKFVLSLHLQNAHGRLVPLDMPIVASVAFAHDHLPVRPPDSGEPPLFTTFNGVEFSAHDNPTRMLGGRATFKLALSLLSSKYENRLFCICFTPQTQPPLICPSCFSPPIRSISRKRTSASSYNSSHLFMDGAASPMNLSRISTHVPPHLHVSGCFPHSPDHSTTYSECSKYPSCCNGADASEHTDSVDETSHLKYFNNLTGGAAQLGFLIRSLRSASEAMDDHRLHAAEDHAPPLSHKPHRPEDGSGPYSDQHMMTQLILSPTSTVPPLIMCRSGHTVNHNAGAMCRLNTPSPVDSGSPDSTVTQLASESCIDQHGKEENLKSQVSSVIQNRTMQGSIGRPLSAPSPPVTSTRPLRPQASIGGCKFPFGSTSFNPGINKTCMPSFMQRAVIKISPSGAVDTGADPSELEATSNQQSSSRSTFVLGAVQHLSTAAALPKPVQERLDSLMRSFMCSNNGFGGPAGTNLSNRRMWRSPSEDGGVRALGNNYDQQVPLEEEERAIHYLELSLYEVAMEIQKRKEEVRVKRRRILDNEACVQYNQRVSHQPSAWLSNIMGS